MCRVNIFWLWVNDLLRRNSLNPYYINEAEKQNGVRQDLLRKTSWMSDKFYLKQQNSLWLRYFFLEHNEKEKQQKQTNL